MLAKYDLIRLGAVSWRGIDSIPNNYIFKYWEPQTLWLDQTETTDLNHYQLPNQYQYSFMQVIAESTTDRFFITEKTATALFYNKLFIVFGCKHYHRYLKLLGFELYDELFDYSFDDEEESEQRADGVVQNLNKFRDKTTEELEQLLETVKDKIAHNRKLAIQYALNPPEIFKEIAVRLKADPTVETSGLVQTIEGINQCKTILNARKTNGVSNND